MVAQSKELKYTGEIQPKSGEIYRGEVLYPYIADPELIKAVNLAITLNRPLLLEGEPGGGKSQLAKAIAYELQLPYKYYFAKSISKITDLLYQFNTISQLRDAQLASFMQDPAAQAKIKNPRTYITLGPLGEAFLHSMQSQQQTVVLIDEIDKADTDFPNDLLEILADKKFSVKELKDQQASPKDPDYIPDVVEADQNNIPIIIIASNSEKKLSNAFLRRCLYYYVQLPDEKSLKVIINKRFPNYDQKILQQALEIFMNLREQMTDDNEERQNTKIISTSEWIDWCYMIKHSTEEFNKQYDAGTLPFAQVLLKSQKDRELYLKLENINNP